MESILSFLEPLWKYTGLLCWILLIAWLLLRAIYGKNWMLRVGMKTVVGTGLMTASKKLLQEVEQKNPQKETLVEVAVQVFWRLTRIGIFAVVIAFIPFILLIQQNSLIQQQNDRIDIQNNLLEADRKSSLVFLMSNVLDLADAEIQKQHGMYDDLGRPLDSIGYHLSKGLLGRIIALSRAFRPYRMMEGDTLSADLVSPERGQLFIALMENGLDSVTQNTIVEKGDFSNAIIGEINLTNAYLSEADLSEADLRGADLFRAKLSGADLFRANLSGAYLSGADLREAYLSGAYLIGAYLRGAYLFGADLSEADLSEADFIGADLSGANFSGANLSGAGLLNIKSDNLFNQLKEARSLYGCENLDPIIQAQLEEAKPCLFTKEGCPVK